MSSRTPSSFRFTEAALTLRCELLGVLGLLRTAVLLGGILNNGGVALRRYLLGGVRLSFHTSAQALISPKRASVFTGRVCSM